MNYRSVEPVVVSRLTVCVVGVGVRLYGARRGGAGSQVGTDSSREARAQLHDGQPAH